MAFRTSHNLRAYYSAPISAFLQQSVNEILGIIHTNDVSAETTIQQSNTWEAEVRILKNQLQAFSEGHIIFKYTIPRKGNVYWTQLVLKYGWLCICRIISGLLKPEGGIEHGKPFSV